MKSYKKKCIVDLYHTLDRVPSPASVNPKPLVNGNPNLKVTFSFLLHDLLTIAGVETFEEAAADAIHNANITRRSNNEFIMRDI